MKQHDNLPTPFDGYEIQGFCHFGTGPERYCERHDNANAHFWSLFGNIPRLGLNWIGDFVSREDAETMYSRITGRSFRDRKSKSDETETTNA